eukprot:gb/GECG01009614.1/.p1 GENE.gb/GECG01009614.1/~~gb/GECG01009614.1/.p1  ORF type:complete len:110 (+),score=14.50 gb/GECG01009614.1/:1-330(+)
MEPQTFVQLVAGHQSQTHNIGIPRQRIRQLEAELLEYMQNRPTSPIVADVRNNPNSTRTMREMKKADWKVSQMLFRVCAARCMYTPRVTVNERAFATSYIFCYSNEEES